MEWEDIGYEDLINNIEMLEPSDYYFQLEMADFTDSDHYFSITPKDYFDQFGYLLDVEEVVSSKYLPKDFNEVSDSTYIFDGDPQIGRQLLLNAGFIEKKMF